MRVANFNPARVPAVDNPGQVSAAAELEIPSSVATLGTWVAAINHQHRTTGHWSPSVHELVTATLSVMSRDASCAKVLDPLFRG